MDIILKASFVSSLASNGSGTVKGKYKIYNENPCVLGKYYDLNNNLFRFPNWTAILQDFKVVACLKLELKIVHIYIGVMYIEKINVYWYTIV
jgi:hypothetical protein